jgi:hypothetical protein
MLRDNTSNALSEREPDMLGEQRHQRLPRDAARDQVAEFAVAGVIHLWSAGRAGASAI